MPWIVLPKSSLLISGAIASLLILDLIKPGHKQFALIPSLKPQAVKATDDLFDIAVKTGQSLQLPEIVPSAIPSSEQEAPALKSLPVCASLLDIYKKGKDGKPICTRPGR
ncbi:MAG: hypothetical protein WBB28_20880 [Crinalium sp.]